MKKKTKLEQLNHDIWKEVVINIGSGVVEKTAILLIAAPAFGFPVNLQMGLATLGVSVILTGISLVRMYIVRHYYHRKHINGK